MCEIVPQALIDLIEEMNDELFINEDSEESEEEYD